MVVGDHGPPSNSLLRKEQSRIFFFAYGVAISSSRSSTQQLGDLMVLISSPRAGRKSAGSIRKFFNGPPQCDPIDCPMQIEVSGADVALERRRFRRYRFVKETIW